MPEGVLESGRRVYVRHPQLSDAKVFLDAVHRSRALHAPWVTPPATRAKFRTYVDRQQQPQFDDMLVLAKDGHCPVGVLNIGHIQHGLLCSAYMGYYAFLPHAGQGFMSEGLQLALRRVFTTLKLHRIEANIQPENKTSIAFVRHAGFTKEGFSRRYLKIRGRWRDHERWALLREDWQVRRRQRRSRG